MNNTADISFLCVRLKELREKNNVTMEEMTKKIADIDNGVKPDKSAISRVESGKTSEKTLLEMARKYCEVFGMSPAQTEQFMRGDKIAIPDTSALFLNTQLINELNAEYSKVIIPVIVMNELDYRKNHDPNEKNRKLAWEIIRGISYGEKIISGDYTGPNDGRNNDQKIIYIAEEASKKYSSEVDIITNDTDYSAYLKKENTHVSALPIKEYMKKKQDFLNMDRLDHFDSMYLDSYEGVEKPSPEEANGYLRDGNTMIISAVRNNKVTFEQKKKKIQWLISCGADVDKRDCARRYFPPITHAVQKNDYEMVAFLLNECNANPNVGSRDPHDAGYLRQKNEGNMPLMIAAWHGRENLVRLLCQNEKTSINQQDANGYTALMKACMNGNIRCRDILQEYGADEKIVDINGMTFMDHYNTYLEKGPAEKKFNRGNGNNSHYNNRRRY